MSKHQKYWHRNRYMSRMELSKLPECVCNYNVLAGRLDRGWDVVKALTTPVRPKNREFVVWKGERVKTTELYRKEALDGLSYELVCTRLNLGWSVEDALKTPLKKPKTYDYFGKQLTITQLSRLPVCVVEIHALWGRLEKYNWDLADALVTPKGYKAEEDPMDPAERKKWNLWLATPMEIIEQRAMEYWEKEQKNLLTRSRYGFGHKI